MKVAEINLRSKSKAVCAAFCASCFGSLKTFMKPGKTYLVPASGNCDLLSSSLERSGAGERLRKLQMERTDSF
jgi:hypothetical protein